MSYYSNDASGTMDVPHTYSGQVIGNGRTVHNSGKENGNVVFGRIVNNCTRWEGDVYQLSFPPCKIIHNSTKYDVAILLPTVMHSTTIADYPAW